MKTHFVCRLTWKGDCHQSCCLFCVWYSPLIVAVICTLSTIVYHMGTTDDVHHLYYHWPPLHSVHSLDYMCTISYHFWPSVTLLHCVLLGDQYHEHQLPLSLWAHQLLIGRHSVGFLPFFEFPSHKGRDENKKCWNGPTSPGINQGEGSQYLLSSADEEVQTKTCNHRRLRTSGTKWGLEWSHWSWT